MTAAQRPAKPKRLHRGIEGVWSNRAGAWCWRARRHWEIDGRTVVRVGRIHRKQEAAAADFLSMDAAGRARRGLVVTLGDALDAVSAAAELRSVSAPTLAALRTHARYLLRFWLRTTHLEWLGEEELLWFAREAVADGASPNSLHEKYLPILAQCFEIAELPNPVPAARAKLKLTIKRVPPRLQYLTPERVGVLIERMRSEVFRDERGVVVELPAREAHADLVALFATTGVRTLELSRVKLEDVDMDRGEVHVRHAKDASNPRRLFVGERMRPVIARILARGEAEHRAGRNPERLLLPGLRWTALNVFTRWGKRLGEPLLNGRVLRHSFITGVLEFGGSSYDARVLAGHRSLATTDRYVHELQRRRPCLDRLDAAILPGAAPAMGGATT